MFRNPHGPVNCINEGLTVDRFPEERRRSKFPCAFTGLCIIKGGDSDGRYPDVLRGKFFLKGKSS